MQRGTHPPQGYGEREDNEGLGKDFRSEEHRDLKAAATEEEIGRREGEG